MLRNFGEVLEAVEAAEPRCVAVAAANEISIIEALRKAHDSDVGIPTFFGDAKSIRRMAGEIGWNLPDERIIDVPDPLEAAAQAVLAVREGRCDVLMKGQIHTDDFLRAVLDKEKGLRTGVTMSHVFVMEVSGLEKLIFVTDGAMNIAPDLVRKAEIILNAVYLANAFGLEMPKVAVLGAVEVVNPAMPATLEAAAIAKMGDRRQFPGCVIDGPLGLDNAISSAAARIKNIESPVAGQADILLVPDVESGNMLVKCFSHLGGGRTAGVLVGASAPVVLTSRADSAQDKFLSIAVAALMANMTRLGRVKIGRVHY
jgi:phosphate butyryltransferase